MKLKVLVGCERSQVVCRSFRRLGHEAYSCDIEPESSFYPEWHIQGDVRHQLTEEWDLLIAHPPCTHLSVAGAAWFKKKGMLQEYALDFVLELLAAPIKHIALENPVSVISTKLRKPDQIVHPWMFGEEYSKPTCFWLVNLPPLVPTKIVGKGEFLVRSNGKRDAAWHGWLWPGEDRAEIRSRTFDGIAKAMARQWGDYVIEEKKKNDNRMRNRKMWNNLAGCPTQHAT